MKPVVLEPVRVPVGLAVIIVVIHLVKKPAMNLVKQLVQVQLTNYQHKFSL